MVVSVLSDAVGGGNISPESQGHRSGLLLTFVAAIFVLVLALGAMFWPKGKSPSLSGRVLIFEATGDANRLNILYRPLVNFLTETSGHEMDLQIAATRGEFLASAGDDVDFIFCPDGLALQLDPDLFQPLVAGRRNAPKNLRPRHVLVYRLASGLMVDPWLNQPARTVLGDSLSLAGSGVALKGRAPGELNCSWGPDPYDHSPVLHAARLGAFDYALVRQWDADRFFESGLLSRDVWGQESLSDPLPDLVLMARKGTPPRVRLDVREKLAAIGRSDDKATVPTQALVSGLPLHHLAGFNILLEPDFDRIRGIFKDHWQASAD